MKGRHRKIMNEENEWNRMVEADVVEGPVEKITCKVIVEAMQKLESKKSTKPSAVSVEMIVASSVIGIKVMMGLCQLELNNRRIPDE